MIGKQQKTVVPGKLAARQNQSAIKPATREVVLVVFPGVNLLDVAGPAQVFTTASEILADTAHETTGAYGVRLVSAAGGLMETTSGIELNTQSLKQGGSTKIDTLLVSGGHGSETAGSNQQLVSWLRAARSKVRRFGSICTGAFVLAGAGLLEGKRAATHWAYCDRLEASYPGIQVERDAIFIQDGGIWTSAGITSGMDLALAMVEEDWGRELALLVSRRLVVFLKRSGGQSQFSVPLQAQAVEGRLTDVVRWVVNHPAADLSVESLAARACVSQRTLHRLFLETFATSPAEWVERTRLEAARQRLEGGDDLLEQVADAVGFASADTMRRVFLRRLGVSPSDYRDRFRLQSATSPDALQVALHGIREPAKV
jgi:transcriptional regulator GlxA family with amidase domain